MTTGYVLVVIAVTFPLLVLPGISDQQPISGNLVIWGFLVAALTPAFVLFCWVKTDGNWRWRWGKGE
jgi:hypothetical protein